MKTKEEILIAKRLSMRKYRLTKKGKAKELEYKNNNKNKIKIAIKKHYTKNKCVIISNVNLYNKTRDSGLYIKYWSMIARCKYKSQYGFKYYGAKGISVEWNSYKDFKSDMYESYLKHFKEFGHKNTTIDRIDNDKNYCKENCRWATIIEQSNNRYHTLSTV